MQYVNTFVSLLLQRDASIAAVPFHIPPTYTPSHTQQRDAIIDRFVNQAELFFATYSDYSCSEIEIEKEYYWYRSSNVKGGNNAAKTMNEIVPYAWMKIYVQDVTVSSYEEKIL